VYQPPLRRVKATRPKFPSSISDKSLRGKAKRALSLEICSH
jgi:hypothetical protein